MSAYSHVRRFGAIGSFLALALIISSLLAACGSTTTGGSSSNCTVAGTSFDTSQFHLAVNNTLTVASDTTYPPQEFQDPNNPGQYIGFDLDIIREIGKRICLGTVTIQPTSFDSIITGLTTPTLGHQRYDLSISAFSITPERQQKVDMVPYFQAGESLLVANGNPQNIQSLNDLCGKTVAVEKATVELDELNKLNDAGGACASNKINILSFTSQDDVITQLLNGRAVATYQDSPVTGYYVTKNPGKVQQGPITVAPSPEGIVMRKDNTQLELAVKKALCSMQQDGKYTSILNQWGQQSGALPADQFVCS
jgi:polar amino acid transport system substrate-binding protein